MHSWHSDFISQVRFFVFWEINFIAANKRSQVLEVDKWKYLDQSWAMLAIISLYSLVSLVVISKPCTNQSHFCLRKISKYYICVYINICNAKVVCSALLNDSCMWFSLQKQSLPHWILAIHYLAHWLSFWIVQTQTGPGDRPLAEIRINRVTIHANPLAG